MANGTNGDDYARMMASTPIGVQRRVDAPPMPGRIARMRDALSTFKESVGRRFDTWTNAVTGFGTARDKTEYGFILPSRYLTDTELSALYHSDDMAARMVDVVPQEMMREGFVVETGDADLDTAVADKLEAIGLRAALAEAIRWGRCFGGGAILLGADDGRDAATPLVPERAKDLSYLYVLDRRLLWPLSYYDEPGGRFGEPMTYLVTTIGGYSSTTSVVHESRLVLFGGAPTGIHEKLQLNGWDMSVLQRAFDVLRQFNVGWKSVETMMTDGNQAIFKMSGLEAILSAPGGGEEVLRTRLQAMDLYRSVMRAIVVDADGKETFERQQVSFEQIPQTLDKFMLRLAASVEIPVTILMGQSPAGMNATGESDFRWFYDRIRSKQTTDLSPRIRRVVSVFLATKAGRQVAPKPPKALNVKFPALWTETPLAQAQREKAIADRDGVYIDKQVLTPDEVALERFRPEGFSNEIVLRPESVKARERALATDLEKIAMPMEEQPPEGVAVEGAPAIAAGAEDAGKSVEIPLAPTDIATVVTVNEARRSLGLPPFQGPDGDLTMPAYKAKHAEAIAAAAQAETGTDPNDPTPPAPFGGGFGGGGAPPFARANAPDDEQAEPAGEATAEKTTGEEPADDPFPLPRADAKLTLAQREAAAFISAWEVKARRARLDAAPRTFTLYRIVDESGVSGTGEVAEGCLFGDGRVAMRWKTATAATTMFDRMEDVLKVHGHSGKTEVRWHDEARP